MSSSAKPELFDFLLVRCRILDPEMRRSRVVRRSEAQIARQRFRNKKSRVGHLLENDIARVSFANVRYTWRKDAPMICGVRMENVSIECRECRGPTNKFGAGKVAE